ncbi:hypothetical protein B0A49_07421 [Cryomyces minteri]|uniref:Protein ARV n=1 Tax=Cryomyces minteri TaxID=331657 RepID=A0A4U0WQQ6_9PEZI|nr:hypothetical protein B0A49_07421 [Cryomyces minteri]
MASNIDCLGAAVVQREVHDFDNAISSTCAAATPQVPRKRCSVKYVKKRRRHTFDHVSDHGIFRKRIRPHATSAVSKVSQTFGKKAANIPASGAMLEVAKPSAIAKESRLALPADDMEREPRRGDDRPCSSKKDGYAVPKLDREIIRQGRQLPDAFKYMTSFLAQDESDICLRMRAVLQTPMATLRLKPPKLGVRASGVPSAGMGLFADERISRGTFLGDYEGPRVHDEDSHDDSYDKVALFQITRTTCINAIKNPSNTFFINCKNDRTCQNAEFLYVEGEARRKVIAVARKNIPKGRVIFASYGPNTERIFQEGSTRRRPRKHSKSAGLIHDGKPLTPGEYVFIKGGTDDENYPWIAKVESILEHERIRISLGRDDDKLDPSILRLGVLLLLFDVYLTWARIEKATAPSSWPPPLPGMPSNGTQSWTNASAVTYGQDNPAPNLLATQPIFVQYLFFLALCTLETIAFHLPIRLLTSLPHLPVLSTVIPRYPRPSLISTALLVSSFTKLFPLLLLIWNYDLPSSASAVSWAVIINNVAALEILLDCGYLRAFVLAGIGAICRAGVGWGILKAVGVGGGVAAAGVVETGDLIGLWKGMAEGLGVG